MIKREFRKGTLINGDCMKALNTIPDDSVDCVITSPPYYQLRDYGYPEQWGLEPDYRDYLDKMINLMKELKRVLKPSGTMWINLGDTYMNNSSYCATGRQGFGKNKVGMLNKKDDIIAQKSLMLIPQRFAIRCIDELGLICRNEIIWAKPNGMPESVTDRFTKKHEQIYFFTKEPKYFFDLDAVRLSYIDNYSERLRNKGAENWAKKTHGPSEGVRNWWSKGGKNPGDVADFWDIPTKPNSSNHYATYNSDLIIKPLLAGCPEGGIVLDPFAGTGTTGLTAINYNRRYIMIEASHEYYNDMYNRIIIAESQPSLWEQAS